MSSVVVRVPIAMRCLDRVKPMSDLAVRHFWSYRRPPSTPLDVLDATFGHMYREMRSLDRVFNDTFGRYRPMRRILASPWFFDAARYRPIDYDEYEVPIEVNDDGKGRRLSIKVDVSHFKPEEVKVTLDDDHVLTIRATHVEEKSEDGGRVLREYVRQYTLPNDVIFDSIKSLLAEDGKTLTVEASLPAIEDSATAKEIPIERAGSTSPSGDSSKK